MNTSTVVSVDGLYRVLHLYVELKISQEIKRDACLALKPTHDGPTANSTTQAEVESFREKL